MKAPHRSQRLYAAPMPTAAETGKEFQKMKWHPHAKFAMPGVIALFFVALFQGFIPPQYRPYVFGSVALTLILGLVTGQFHRMAQQRREEETPQDEAKPQPQQEETIE